MRTYHEVVREISAGGLVIRRDEEGAFLAAIRPRGRPEGHWALPKGRVEPGESALDAALREVREETGIEAEAIAHAGDVRYVYMRGGQRILKFVSFWWMRPIGGQIGVIEPAMRAEVSDVRWLPLADAPRLLAYRDERRLALTLEAVPGV